MSAVWHCTLQRAGPLVKECRSLRPPLGPSGTRQDATDKRQIRKGPHSAVTRTQVDRLELRMALFGYEGTHYTQTYDFAHLPKDYDGVCRYFRAYRARLLRWRNGEPFDWLGCIEGRHGDHRYHIHLVLRYSDFPPAVVRHLWRAGEVDDEPVLMPTGGYRRLAEYLTKERTDGIIIPIGRRPWNCSRSLSQQLPPPERWRDESGIIDIPDDVLWARRGERSNSFGAYAYASYIQSNSFFNLSRAPACAPARIQS